jgi:glycolate oxidase iron-sulfur subunit
VTVKEYALHLAHDPAYAEKARRISALTKDLGELLPDIAPALKNRLRRGTPRHLAFHPPCTLQHGQQLRGGVEQHLAALGFKVELARSETHLCCGSAGTYSVLQPELATSLRDRKLAQLEPVGAEVIVSANIGCIQHLQTGTKTPVRHWVEVLDEALSPSA